MCEPGFTQRDFVASCKRALRQENSFINKHYWHTLFHKKYEILILPKHSVRYQTWMWVTVLTILYSTNTENYFRFLEPENSKNRLLYIHIKPSAVSITSYVFLSEFYLDVKINIILNIYQSKNRSVIDSARGRISRYKVGILSDARKLTTRSEDQSRNILCRHAGNFKFQNGEFG